MHNKTTTVLGWLLIVGGALLVLGTVLPWESEVWLDNVWRPNGWQSGTGSHSAGLFSFFGGVVLVALGAWAVVRQRRFVVGAAAILAVIVIAIAMGEAVAHIRDDIRQAGPPRPPDFDWSYGIGLYTVGVGLVAATIASLGLVAPRLHHDAVSRPSLARGKGTRRA